MTNIQINLEETRKAYEAWKADAIAKGFLQRHSLAPYESNASRALRLAKAISGHRDVVVFGSFSGKH